MFLIEHRDSHHLSQLVVFSPLLSPPLGCVLIEGKTVPSRVLHQGELRKALLGCHGCSAGGVVGFNDFSRKPDRHYPGQRAK